MTEAEIVGINMATSVLEEKVHLASNELVELRKQLCIVQNHHSTPLAEVLTNANYDRHRSTSTRWHVAANDAMPSFDVPGRNVCIGTTELPPRFIARATVANMSLFLDDIWHARFEGNLFDRIRRVLALEWQLLRNTDLFLLPINFAKATRGKPCDLPILSYAMAQVFFEQRVELAVIDRHSSSKATVVNVSHVLRAMQVDNVHRVRFPKSTGGEGMSCVLYMRSAGPPDAQSIAAIYKTTGVEAPRIVYIHTASATCSTREDVKESYANVLCAFASIDSLAAATGYTSIGKIYIVLDECAIYAVLLAAAAEAYNVSANVDLLAYHRGVYSIISVSGNATS